MRHSKSKIFLQTKTKMVIKRQPFIKLKLIFFKNQIGNGIFFLMCEDVTQITRSPNEITKGEMIMLFV
jgi:hypothetical protein